MTWKFCHLKAAQAASPQPEAVNKDEEAGTGPGGAAEALEVVEDPEAVETEIIAVHHMTGAAEAVVIALEAMMDRREAGTEATIKTIVIEGPPRGGGTRPRGEGMITIPSVI